MNRKVNFLHFTLAPTELTSHTRKPIHDSKIRNCPVYFRDHSFKHNSYSRLFKQTSKNACPTSIFVNSIAQRLFRARVMTFVIFIGYKAHVTLVHFFSGCYHIIAVCLKMQLALMRILFPSKNSYFILPKFIGSTLWDWFAQVKFKNKQTNKHKTTLRKTKDFV